MGNLRPVLIIGLVFLGYMLWVEWQKDYGPQSSPLAVETTSPNETLSTPSADSIDAADLPLPDESRAVVSQTPDQGTGTPQDMPSVGTPADTAPTEMKGENPFVTVTTDVLDLEIDLTGGTVISALLLDYPVVHKDPDTKVNLFSRQGDHMFIAQSGLLSQQSAPNHTSQFQTARKDYELAAGAEEIRVPLT